MRDDIRGWVSASKETLKVRLEELLTEPQGA